MEQGDKNEVDDHQDQGADGGVDSKQSDQTDDGEIDSSCCLLQSAWVDETLGVDSGIVDIQHVVPISQVDQINANGCKSQDQRCNDRIGDCYQGVSSATHVTTISSLTNSRQERIDRKDGAPTESRESRKSFVHLPWRAIEELAQNPVQDHPNQLQHSARTDGQALEDEVGDVEVGGFGEVLT